MMHAAVIEIGIGEFRDNAEKYIRGARRGRSFTIMSRSKPLFKIVPAEVRAEPEYDLDEIDGSDWKTLVDFSKIRKGGVPAEDIIAVIDRVYGQD